MLVLASRSPVSLTFRSDALLTVRQHLFPIDLSFVRNVSRGLSAHTPLTVKQSTARKRAKKKKVIDSNVRTACG